MPQRPAQVGQGSSADVLAVLIPKASVIGRIVERSCPLEVRSCGDEISRRHQAGAESAVGKTERGSVVLTLGFSEKILGRLAQHGTLSADVMARPYPVKNGEFLGGGGGFINEILCRQKNVLRLGRCISAACDHRLAEHHLQFQL